MTINFDCAESRNHGFEFRKSANPLLEKGNSPESDNTFPGLIPDAFFKDLPSCLNSITELSSSKTERDILLLGSITCLSAAFDNVSAMYDSHRVYPNLYLFVSAPAGVGKGALNFCREIIKPIHMHLRELAKREKTEYNKSLKENAKNGNSELLEKPKMRMFLIPANSSAASLQKILLDNDGVGLMFETEGDTLSQTLKRDYGQYSDILRKAFHHEPVTMSRKENQEYLEIQEPKISVVLAGTPNQVRNLIPSAENGLMSRSMFYNVPFSLETRDVFDPKANTKLDRIIEIGKHVCQQIEQFHKQGKFNFVINEDDRETFNSILNQITEECTSINVKLLGTARRIGLIGFRIMKILTILRELDSHKVEDQPFDGNDIQLVCSEEDFCRTIMLMRTLTEHAIYMFYELESNKDKTSRSDIWESIIDQMPDAFTKHDLDVKVKELGYNIRTEEYWLRKFIDTRKLTKISHGVYGKIPP